MAVVKGMLLIEWSALALGGADNVEVLPSRVGSFVELVYHILIKLFADIATHRFIDKEQQFILSLGQA